MIGLCGLHILSKKAKMNLKAMTLWTQTAVLTESENILGDSPILIQETKFLYET